MEKEKNYSPSGDGQGDLPSPAEQLAIERNQRLRAEIERKEKEIAKMEVELAKSQEEARQAELRVYALNTLIDVADETYAGIYERSWEKASRRTLIPMQSDSIPQTTTPPATPSVRRTMRQGDPLTIF